MESTMYYDKTNAMSFTQNPVLQSSTKHVELTHDFIRDHIQKGGIAIEFVRTHDQLGDISQRLLG